MKLAASNIAWQKEYDEHMLEFLADNGFSGLEIAPTRIFAEHPYEHINEIKKWANRIKNDYKMIICSMQSIWYGKTERIFGTKEEYDNLLEYTKKAIEFAEAAECNNLVFGCPKNRIIPLNADERIAIEFFKTIGDYAFRHGTTVSIEANPPIYHTNYINTTIQAFELIDKVDSKGFKLNFDFGTVIYNKEKINSLKGLTNKINHIHISEPNLLPVLQRPIHDELFELLNTEHYDKYISIEMKSTDTLSDIKSSIEYIRKKHMFFCQS